jgi:hypothetical protein
MTAHVPHLRRSGSVARYDRVGLLLCAASRRPRLAQQPDPEPLWKAYPLAPRTSTNAAPSSAPQRCAQRAALTCGAYAWTAPLGRRRPLAVAVVAYGALAFLAFVVIGATARHIAAPQGGTGHVRDQLGPRRRGRRLPRRAAGRRRGTRRGAVSGASSAARLSPRTTIAASHEAYEQLLRALYAEGWQPYERGRQWWEMRLRHRATSGTSSPARHG